MPEYFNTNTHPFLQAASTVGNIVVLYHDEEGSIYIGASGGGGGGTPGGSDTQVQFNDGSAFGGDPNFTFNKTTNRLSVDFAQVLDDPFASGWDTNNDVPTKNAIYDKFTGYLGGSAADGRVIFNDGGAAGNDAGFVYNKTTDSATLLGNMSASGFIATGETANRVAIFDGNKKISFADTATYPSLTELAHVKGLTSNAQTQLDSKLSSADVKYIKAIASFYHLTQF